MVPHFKDPQSGDSLPHALVKRRIAITRFATPLKLVLGFISGSTSFLLLPDSARSKSWSACWAGGMAACSDAVMFLGASLER
jgi:hypothetical protein